MNRPVVELGGSPTQGLRRCKNDLGESDIVARP